MPLSSSAVQMALVEDLGTPSSRLRSESVMVPDSLAASASSTATPRLTAGAAPGGVTSVPPRTGDIAGTLAAVRSAGGGRTPATTPEVARVTRDRRVRRANPADYRAHWAIRSI